MCDCVRTFDLVVDADPPEYHLVESHCRTGMLVSGQFVATAAPFALPATVKMNPMLDGSYDTGP